MKPTVPHLPLWIACLALGAAGWTRGQETPQSAVDAAIQTGEDIIDVAVPPPPGAAAPAEEKPASAPPTVAELTAAGPEGQLARESVVARRDADSALSLGWAYYEKSQWRVANEWFEHALSFDPQQSRAAEGLIMSSYRSGDIGGAYQLATT
ncbi:MAG: hypothetical protein KDM64_19475, partial [Verrucomicrobiae bacterium]|nr:hypothetical protein [Verrucomicrobiae bacterium]